MAQAERGSPALEIRIFHRAMRRSRCVARKLDRLHQRNDLPRLQRTLTTATAEARSTGRASISITRAWTRSAPAHAPALSATLSR
jgi:hypothetical protein